MSNSFHGVIAFALLASMLLLGSILRNRISWLSHSLIPSSIIGGLIGFVLLSLDLIPGFTPQDFTTLTFHLFTLSFMSLCLTGKSKDSSLHGGSIVRGGLFLTAIWSASLGLQAVLGYSVFAGYDSITGSGLSEWLGAIVTTGFTQGPGQALTYGGIWEEKFGIADAPQVGMIYASLGFLVAFLVGIPLARHYIHKGLNANKASKIDEHFVSGFYRLDEAPSAGNVISHPANLDSLAYHISLLGVAYVLTYVWLNLMQPLVAGLHPFGLNVPILFSFNLFFIHGLLIAVLMRMAIDRLGLAKYVDDATINSVTGSSVDMMVVGTLMSIKFSVLYALLLPVLLVTVVVTAVTLALCLFVGKLSGKLGLERALTAFGCCCGSSGTGLLLLRMMDADFSTSVPKELAFFNLAIVVANIHLAMIFLPIAPSMSTWAFFAIFGGQAVLACLAIPLLMKRQPSPSTQTA